MLNHLVADDVIPVSTSINIMRLGFRAALPRSSGGGGFADDEFGGEADRVGVGLAGRLDALNEKLGGGHTHLVQRLADGA